MNTNIKVLSSAASDTAVSLLFGGDFCPIRGYEKKILSGGEIFSTHIMKELSNKDCFIINLESPLCNSIQNEKLYKGGMGCDPAVAAGFKKFHIDIAGLANNHILDKTPEGLMQTIKILKEQKILFGGAGKNYADASEPVQIEINGLRICFLITAEKELNIAGPSSPGSALFNPSTDPYVIQETKNNCDFLICYVHAGHEFMLTPSPRIRNSFRSFIDAGADAVIGHHPHVPQGYEQYRGGWIFYSLGNLIFDSPYVSAYPNTDIGYLVRLGIKKRKTNSVEIIPYRLRENHMVTELSEQEQHELNSMFSRINAVIADDGLFEEEWAKNVITRWNQDYRKIYQDFSNRYRDDNNPYFLSWMRNMVQCPTHHEIVLKALDLIEEKKLTK